jgi:hypothetical protein
MSLLDYGHYVRGGLSVGPLGQAVDMIAGRALIEAVNLERSVAKYRGSWSRTKPRRLSS